MNPFTRGPALVFENAPDEIATRLSTASAGIDDADERKMTDALAMAALAPPMACPASSEPLGV